MADTDHEPGVGAPWYPDLELKGAILYLQD